MTALGGTGAIFLALSAAVVSRKDFSFMGSFLMVGILVAFLADWARCCSTSRPCRWRYRGCSFLMSGMILWQTSEIIHGGRTNHIMATVSLYITIFNLLLSLLQILGVVSGDD